MKTEETTVDESQRSTKDSAPSCPGVLLIYTLERPSLRAFPIRSEPIELGRNVLGDDDRTSRRHVRIGRDQDRWRIADLESRNGTFVDGVRITGEVAIEAPKALRIGRSLFVFEREVRAFEQLENGVELREGVLLGPRLRETFARLDRAAQFGDTLFIRGESGSGKELAARAFHAYGGRGKEPFVAVNCAAIPEGVAERLLFGAKRGAFSGANADAEGYVQAADGGTLFLDEVAELDLAVQAKLLRVLETKQVMALGEATPRKIQLRVCSATHRDLRASVAAGRFREDLYFRIGRPEVQIPPLRERPEEIPWHVARELERLQMGQSAHAGFIEACLLRLWPGNVRELITEVRRAAQEASLAERSWLEAEDLAPDAGIGFEGGTAAEPAAARGAGRDAAGLPAASSSAGGSTTTSNARGVMPQRAEIEDALRAERGNVTRLARRLGLHRNQLRRWLEKNPVAAGSLSDEPE